MEEEYESSELDKNSDDYMVNSSQNDNDEDDGDKTDNLECPENLNYFFDEKTWQTIGKKLEDYNEEDLSKLHFDSLETCYLFYKVYGKVKGFGVRKQGAVKSKTDGHFTSRRIVCNRAGYREQKYLGARNRKRRPRDIKRCGCKAYISFKFDELNKYWFISDFKPEHNHDLVDPQHVSFIRGCREINDTNKSRIKCLIESGIAPSAVMRYYINDAGGPENVEFVAKDLYNAYEAIKKEEILDGDAETVMAFLAGKQSSDPLFFISYTRDDTNILDKLFWCDGKSRNDFNCFGSVIAFDTTYKSNAYNKPFVVIVGVNHHRKTVLFGCALLSDEKEESFVWVLQQMMAAGDNMKPQVVLTDGDKAMANAIRVVLPDAKHRLCLWHLMRNVKVNGGKRFASGFMKCVNKCRTPNEFEKAWEELITHYKFQKKKWVQALYRDKEKWAEAYMHGYFFAGMRSTQRCESMHRTVKKVLNKKIMLYRFVELFYQVLDNIRFSEKSLDYKTKHSVPFIDGVLSSVKSHAAKIYTRNSYDLLCKEMKFEAMHIVKHFHEEKDHPEGPIKCYWLNDTENENSEYIVIHCVTLQKMFCCCMKLESVGLPCRHMFAVMKTESLKEIPRGCLFRRWTIHAKSNIDSNEDASRVEEDSDMTMRARYSHLNSFCSNICHMASKAHSTYQKLLDHFAKLTISLSSKIDVETTTPKKKTVLFDIRDPKVIPGNGGAKKNKQHKTSSEFPTSDQTIEDIDPNIFDLNDTPTQSSEKTFTNDEDHMVGVFDHLKDSMPTSYVNGEASEAIDCYELHFIDTDPTIFDWEPSDNW